MIDIKNKFNEIFKKPPEKLFFAPGRVNLIGEHIDYNGGYVFPCAIDLGTYAGIRLRDDEKINLVSTDFSPHVQIDTNNLQYNKDHAWANYPKGVLYKLGKINQGFDMLITGDLPQAAGLSSSASICVLAAFAFNEIYNFGKTLTEIALLCQNVENDYIGVNCGIMDQFIIANAKKDHAILLDCNSLKYSYAPLFLGEYSLVISNTNKSRELADSKYNERRSECEAALKEIQEHINIKHLCDLTPDKFKDTYITNPINRKRATHAIYENHRTIQAAKVLETGDLTAFGELMILSHKSLCNLYEVTGEHLDIIVEAAIKFDRKKVPGSRMTGAGFGGCSVSIVHKDYIQEFINIVGEAYHKKTGIKADFYIANPADGVKEIL